MNPPKLLAIYYPQFHQIPENDLAWEKGFTDWINVRNAQALFKGHYQPRIPLQNNYYDLSDSDVIKSQVELAQKYGISGFCFYHYWFDGKLLLEKPINNFHDRNDINFPYCISWANETWTKRWIGDSKSIIQEQKHTPDTSLWKKHFFYLLKFFKDSNYIKIDGKPVFIIYQPIMVEELEKMIKLWNKLAKAEGLKGIYFIATKRHDYIPKGTLTLFNGLLKFQPQEVYNSKSFKERSYFSRYFSQKFRFLPERYIDILHYYKQKLEKHRIFNSNIISDHILRNAYQRVNGYNGDIYESVYVNWDNTPRYKKKATIFTHKNPEVFHKELSDLYEKAKANRSEFIFINAWNEWAEGAYLEPDMKYKYEYLDVINNVIGE